MLVLLRVARRDLRFRIRELLEIRDRSIALEDAGSNSSFRRALHISIT